MSETTSGGGGGGGTHNNVFLTTENLAFAMPLILLCTGYAYFLYVPLKYGIPILLGLAFYAGIRHLLRKRKEHKLTHLDEKTIKDLVGDDDDETDEASKLKDKARNRLKNRIAQEKKARNRRAGTSDGDENNDDDVDDDADVSAFVNAKKKGR